MIIPNITPLPPSPQRTDPATFAARADASLTAQETVFTPELNAFASAVNVTQAEMTVLSDTATTQAQIATTQAAAAASSALSAGATVWVSGTTYAVGVSRYSPLDGQVYRRMVGGAGTTDPSLDAVNWRVVNGLTSELIVLPFNNLPSIRPSLSLDFANNQSVDPRITFTRASTATRTNNKGLIESVASGVPRIDFDAVTGACRGLLIEEQRTNLLTYSEAFDNAAWSKNASSISSNTTTSPDGAVTADFLVESAVSSDHSLYSVPTLTAATAYTFSYFVKAGSRTKVGLSLGSTAFGGTNIRAHFDLSTGLFIAGFNSPDAYSITALSNGWYRLSITKTTVASGAGSVVIYTLDAAGSIVYTGDGTSGLFILGAQLEAGAFPTTYQPSTETFTGRASTATFYGSNGLIQTASSGVARMNYNPANLTVQPKLLLEAAGTNLLTYSEAFDNAYWGKSNTTVIANATTSPDGLLTADKLVEDAVNIEHYIDPGLSVTSGTVYVFSMFVKAAERSKVRLRTVVNFPDLATVFDIATGLVNTSTHGVGNSGIAPVGNGWYRCWVIATANGTGGGVARTQMVTEAGLVTYAGTTGYGLFIWGAQLEASPYATSYIPTVASQVTRVADTSTSAQTTRAADVATMTGANFSSWYRQDEGSFVAGFDVSSTTDSGTHVLFGAGVTATYAESMYLFRQASSGNINSSVVDGGVVQVGQTIGALAANAPASVSFAYKLNDCSGSLNGAANVSDTAATINSADRFSIGASPWDSGSIINGHIRSLSYYPKRLTNAELVALSTQ